MKTKTLKLVTMLLFVASMVQAQGVAIGDKDYAPNAAAILDVQSQNKGVLVPRMSYVQRMYIQTNAQSMGLLVYQTDKDAGFYYWDGLSWKFLNPNTGGTNGSNGSNGADGSDGTGGDYSNLARVASSGDYNDLNNKPDIPTRLQDLQQDENYYTTVTRAERETWNAKSNFSGDFNDIQNKPTIPTMLRDLQTDYNNLTVTEQEKQRWDNKSNFSGNYNDLYNLPDIPTKLSDMSQDGYSRTVTDAEKASWNAKSTFGGSYMDLSDRPNIPLAAQTGSYNDLTNKPFIPSKLSDLDDGVNFRTVTDAQITAWNAKSNFSGKYSDLSELPDIADMVTTAVNARLPIGSVIMWVGTAQTVPSGWRIMSEMIGRFPVGAGTAPGSGGITRSYAVNENQDASGESGQEFVTLTEPQIPPHSHEQQLFSATSVGGRRPAGYTNTADDFGGSGYRTKETGGGGSHENRPPFRALYFIEKVSQ